MQASSTLCHIAISIFFSLPSHEEEEEQITSFVCAAPLEDLQENCSHRPMMHLGREYGGVVYL